MEKMLSDQLSLSRLETSSQATVAASSNDVENCFAIFLGCEPYGSWFNPADGIVAVVRAILNSNEFVSNVLPPLLMREQLPHAFPAPEPTLKLIDWAQRHLPLTVPTRMALGGARTWAQLLEALLADPDLIALSNDLVAAEVDGTLRIRLEREAFFKVTRSVRGAVDSATAFEVKGWAVDVCDKSTPVVLEFTADNLFIGSTRCNEPRPDVQEVLGGSGNFGFTFKISNAHRSAFEGGRTLSVADSVSKQRIGNPVVVASDVAKSWDMIDETRRQLTDIRKLLEQIEARLPEVGRTASVPIEAYNEYWERFVRPSPDILAGQLSRSRGFAYRPLISVVVPTWNSDTLLLYKAIESVVAQSYENWELVLTDDCSGRDEIRHLMERYRDEPRIQLIEGPTRDGIAINTNRGIAAASGDFIAFLDHDDELAPEALFCVVQRLQDERPGLLYSDEDRIEHDDYGRCVHHTPFFKPDFDPDLLLSLNYICHLVVVRRDVLTRIGGLRSGYEGAQDHDLLLRCAEVLAESEIVHIPRVLYHWRVTPGSVSGSPQRAEQIQDHIVAAVDDHLQRRNLPAKAEPHRDPIGSPRQFATRVKWALPDPAPSLSIIIASRDRLDLLKPCMTSVLDSLAFYPGRSEVLLLDNDTQDPATLEYMESLSVNPRFRVVPFQGPFNWSGINNAGARNAEGDVLIFLNNDTLVLTPDWCAELAAQAMRPEVGAVGARLLYADGTIQHAGVVVGIEGVAGHECVGETVESGGYFGRSQVLRGTAAVTGACLATRRKLFLETNGGFDELRLKIAFNDVDFCLRLRKRGYRIIFNPFAVLYHLESKSRGRDISQEQKARHRGEALAFRAIWGDTDRLDPYYNPHFERFARPFDRLRPPPDLDRRPKSWT
jgi:GT2 family glycosyltransferase